MNVTQARKPFGFQNMSQRMKKVEDVITHVEYICTAVDKLAVTKENAVLRNLGLSCSDEDSSDDDGENSKSCGRSMTTLTPLELTTLA